MTSDYQSLQYRICVLQLVAKTCVKAKCVFLHFKSHQQHSITRSYGDGARDWMTPGIKHTTTGLQGELFIHYTNEWFLKA